MSNEHKELEQEILLALETLKKSILDDDDMMKNTSDYWRGQLMGIITAIAVVNKIFNKD